MISVIIVSYNVPELLTNCLKKLETSENAGEFEIIIVDNNSKDNIRKQVLRDHPGVVWIQNSRNLGFASAVNIGISSSKGTHVLLVNPDSEVHPSALNAIQDFWQKYPETGIVGGKIIHTDGTFQKQCRRHFPKPASAFFRLFGLSKLFPNHPLTVSYEMDLESIDELHEIDAVSGAFLSFSMELVQLIGMFDEGYFLMGEDLDFCYRAKMAGKSVVFLPSAILTHHHGASRRSRPCRSYFYGHRAMVRYFNKFLKPQYGKLLSLLVYIGITAHFFLVLVNSSVSFIINGLQREKC